VADAAEPEHGDQTRCREAFYDERLFHVLSTCGMLRGIRAMDGMMRDAA
jgi:hypothetical protein